MAFAFERHSGNSETVETVYYYLCLEPRVKTLGYGDFYKR